MSKNITNKKMHFAAFIHTIEITTKCEPIPIVTIASKPYISKYPIIRSENIHYVINPNKFGYASNLYSLDKCIEAITSIISDMGLTDFEWQLTRVDLAIDTFTEYDELYKINCYIKELFAFRLHCENSYRIIGDDMRKRSTVVKNDYFELEIYNKHIESLDLSLPQTRMEFRRKRLNRRKKKIIATMIREAIRSIMSDIELLPMTIDRFEMLKLRVLQNAYEIESSAGREGRVRNISDFTKKYADFIYSRKSLYFLFCKNRLRNGIQEFNSWLFNYRKTGNVISLFSESSIRKYCKNLISSIKAYSNN